MGYCSNDVYTLSGSTRYKEYFEVVARQLELCGYIVLWPGVYSKSDHIPQEILDWAEDNLKETHRYKIDMCHTMYVINPDGYIGDSTKDEIAYAIKNHKEIMYLESEDEMNQIFNSAAGIDDAIQEMKDAKEQKQYFLSHPDEIYDASGYADTLDGAISKMEEIEDTLKEVNGIMAEMSSGKEEHEVEHDNVTGYHPDGITKFLFTQCIVLMVSIMILFGYISYEFNCLNKRFDQCIETIQQADEDIKDINEDIKDINSALENACGKLDTIYNDLDGIIEKLEEGKPN